MRRGIVCPETAICLGALEMLLKSGQISRLNESWYSIPVPGRSIPKWSRRN
jgi:hypothetical protein